MTEVPTSARVVGAVGRGLITAGVVVLLFVVFQLWGTNIQEARAQDDLRGDFAASLTDAQTQLATLDATSREGTAPNESIVDAGDQSDEVDQLPLPTPTLPGGLTSDVLRHFFPNDGDAVARIEIPAIDVDKIVVNGVQVADLRKGPGHYPGTAAVGTEGNTSFAGHRTTYGAPFNRVDELSPGDEIRVTGVLGTFTYRVMDPQSAFGDQLETVHAEGEGHVIVRPSATWVLGDFDDNRLTLTACHPKLSSRQRIIVAAELVDAPLVAPTFDPELIAAFASDNPDAPVLPGETFDGSPAAQAPASDLDEGLNGEREAIPGAVLWMLAAVGLWMIGGMLGRHLFDERLRRVAVRVTALVPVALCLWFSFEMIDRALPAG